MSRSVNKAIIVGNLGADPEIRSTSGGPRGAHRPGAPSRRWNARHGQQQEKTEWHRIVLWDKLAEIAERYLTKGDSVYIEGEIEYRQYQDKDGVTKYSTEIRARELVMLGSRDGPGGGGGRGSSQSRQPASSAAGGKGGSDESSYDDFSADFPEDDDLPF